MHYKSETRSQSLPHIHNSICAQHEMKCILICLLILICGFLASNVSTLKCVTPDGLQVDEVRKVIKTCMKKVTDTDSAELKNYDEYENFDSGSDKDSERREGGRRDSARHNGRMNNNYNNNYNHNYDYPQQHTGGNYREVDRRNDRPTDPSQHHYNPYQLTYADNNNFSNQRGNFHHGSGQNKNNNDNFTAAPAADVDKHERDRSCILQCFFQELKMVRLNE
jgi:hypothetical protein